MAIGNAPWPIGVDQVGIHMRPSRETISMRYVAHVLNDETQRKFIQGSGFLDLYLVLVHITSIAEYRYPIIDSPIIDTFTGRALYS